MFAHHFAAGAKKHVASVSFTQLIDGQHWFVRSHEQQDALDCIIAISEHDSLFATYVERLAYYGAGKMYVAKTTRRERAQRFTYSLAHTFACELSKHHDQETRVERVSSLREIA